MKALPLTIIILTNRNDSNFIRCLQSSQIAEEVLIIDHHSNNNWKDLAKQYHFSIIKEVDTIHDFSQIRNEAGAYARKEWLFFLDSDEIISPNDYAKLEQCLLDQTVIGWYIKRQDYFYNKPLNFGETGSLSLLRLFQKGKGHFENPIHEVCLVEGKTKIAPFTIQHYAHSSISEFMHSVSVYALQVAIHSEEKHAVVLCKMILYPPLKFIQNFILKQGFRDGYRGFIYALIMSFHSFFVRVYQYEHTTSK